MSPFIPVKLYVLATYGARPSGLATIHCGVRSRPVSSPSRTSNVSRRPIFPFTWRQATRPHVPRSHPPSSTTNVDRVTAHCSVNEGSIAPGLMPTSFHATTRGR